MKFIDKVCKLKAGYDESRCERRDKTILYGLSPKVPPIADHIIHDPMPDDVMKNMVENYMLEFPAQLLEIYREMNGASLFCDAEDRAFRKNIVRIPIFRFSIYGTPLTYDRKHMEPFNISIEDLNRPEGTPKHWLKFGSYSEPKSKYECVDLFADTTSGEVFALENRSPKCEILESWNSIDDCLCAVFDLLSSYFD